MNKLVSPKWAWSTVLAVLSVAAIFVVFRLGNQASAGVDLDDPVVWIEDGQRGEILQINGSTKEVTARVPVGERGDSIVALPRDRDAVFLNRSNGEIGVVGAVSLRVDFIEGLSSATGPLSGEQLQLKADFAASDDVFVIDTEQTLVVEPGAGVRLPIPTPEGLGSTTVRPDGRLVAVTVDGRKLGISSERGIEPLTDLSDPIAGESEEPQLVRSGDSVYVVDFARRTVNEVTEQGRLGGTTCVSGSLSNARVGGSHLSDSSGTPRILVHDAAAGVLSVSEPNRSECFSIDVSVPGDFYGEPVAVDGMAYLPNWGTGRIVIVDLDERAVLSTVPFSSVVGRPFELEVFNNSVWANEPQGPFAAVVTRQGIEPIRKLGRVVISEDGLGGGDSAAIVADNIGGDGRLFGDSGDPVSGNDDGGSGAAAGSGGASVVGGNEIGDQPPTDGTGLSPNSDEPPVGLILNDVDVAGLVLDGLQANFQFSSDTVSVGEEVTFTDDSLGDPVSWNWDFGDGTGAEGPDVVKAWEAEGVFTVQLFVADAAGNQSQQAKDITVIADDVLRIPDALFSFRSSTIEVGEPLEFVSQTTGDPDILAWDFGDGNTATGEVVEHRFDRAGTFEVSLTASNAAGSDTISVPITVVQGVREPEAIISAFPAVLEVGQSVVLRSESTNSPTSVQWDFGDGNSQTGNEVRYSWSEPGTFRVRLSVSNSAGSSSTFRDVVIKPRTDPPVARFGESSLEAIVGEPISFNDLSQNRPTKVTWEFGDGDTASGANVAHSWNREGTYTVTLTVANEAGSDEVAKTVTILPLPPDPPVASFTVQSANVPANAVVNFTDTSTNDPTEWLWNFGDGRRSRAQSPPHAFKEPGTYEVTLTVSNAGGSDSTRQTIVVSNPPVASFDVSAEELRVNFTDTSSNAPTEWRWNFGDGTTSSAQFPTKEYSAAGDYTVTLIASNETGSSSPATRSVSVALRPKADFDVSVTGVTASFTDTSSNGPAQWFWDFGDGTTSTVQSPSHNYGEPGQYSVRLTVSNSAGESSRTVDLDVDFAPPVAAFTCESVAASLICDGTASSGAAEYKWSSKERTVSSSGLDTDRATFTYDRSGSKEITLEVTNLADDDDRTKAKFTVEVPRPPVITGIDVVSNVGGVVRLQGTAENSPTAWSWTAPGAVSATGETTSSPTFTFDEAGSQTIFGVAANAVGPSEQANIKVNVNLLQPPVVTEVVEESNTNGVVALRGIASNSPSRWFWSIPDGVVTGGASTARPTVQFTSNGTFNGSVRAENDDGRSAVFAFSIDVTGVPPLVTAVNVLSNANGVVELEGIATNNPTGWTWSIPGGSITTGQNTSNPSFVFPDNGSYPGTVRATSNNGTSAPRPFDIVVDDLIAPPVASFNPVRLQTAGRYRLENTSTAEADAEFKWGGVTGWIMARNGRNVTVQFPDPGTYTVTLTVTDRGGADTFSTDIDSN